MDKPIIRDTRNTLSKMSFFVRPKSPISSKISSKFLIFVQMQMSCWNVFNLQTDKKCSLEKLMSALILYYATSMLHVLHRHAPDLIDMVVPVSHLTGRCHLHVGYIRHDSLFDVPRSWIAFGSAIRWPFFVQISSKIVNFVFRPKC